jgi:hypothetical protein
MANRFWVGSTGTWDASDTTHWSTTTGGAGGASVPGTSDAALFDANSGGGTVTVNATITIQSITCGAFTGTLDFSANNNNVTLSATGGMSAGGTGTRTVNLGNGTWTLSATSGTVWNFGTVTNLTFNANSSTIVLSGAAANCVVFSGGGLTYNAVQFLANNCVSVVGSNTIGTLTVTAPNAIYLTASTTNTLTNAPTITGTSSSPVAILQNGPATGTVAISCASGTMALDWAAVRGTVFSGGATFTATNSLDLGGNSGITITPPTGGGVVGVIGG